MAAGQYVAERARVSMPTIEPRASAAGVELQVEL